MTATTPAFARLFVLLARTAPVGVILRRGPSDWVQMIHWDTKKDVFTPGQWFHGRIYERKCDLSPNGKLIVYCAYKPGNRATNPDYGDSWTGVSKPPYFTALALWPHRNSWGGGGVFVKHNKMFLNHMDDNRQPHRDHPPKGFNVVQADEYSYMRDSIYEHSLRRDGWQTSTSDRPSVPMRSRHFYMGAWLPNTGLRTALVKTWNAISLVCIIMSHYRILIARGLYGNSEYEIIPEYIFAVRSEALAEEIELPNVTWADFDQQRRLVLAKAGKLFSAAVVDGELSLTELADFNANQPEAIESSDWAKKW